MKLGKPNWSMLLRTAALGLVGTFASLHMAQAAVENISCPLSQARHEVTTRLPGGWWNTPQVRRLQSVRVQNISGRPALICDYGAGVGTVQRYAPDGATCTVRGRGFRCVTAGGGGGAGPVTFSTGQIRLRQTFQADLDRGRVQSAGADIWFQAQTSTRKFLVPINGARFSISGARNRGYDGCSRASYSSGRISLRGLREGTYVCVRTAQGRISEFRVNEINRGSNARVRLGYTTWR